MNHLAVWGGIAAVVIASTVGDILQSRAMKEIGDLGLVRKSEGLGAVIRRVTTNTRFMIGLAFMAVGFFCLLVTLSWGDVSIVGPASASLTFLANALVAHIYLKENVDRRRWMAALCIAGGVALLAQ
ncbi:MAG TPA: EamA family transporter [Terriglobales bacterium]